MPPTHATHLIAGVLDKQLVQKRTKLGNVDGIVIVLRAGKPPRVAYIECGAAVLARRLGRWCARLVGDRQRYRIPWSKVKKIDINVEVELDEHPLLAWEEWLSEHVVGRIPFAK
jgi:hypothetical protein